MSVAEAVYDDLRKLSKMGLLLMHARTTAKSKISI